MKEKVVEKEWKKFRITGRQRCGGLIYWSDQRPWRLNIFLWVHSILYNRIFPQWINEISRTYLQNEKKKNYFFIFQIILFRSVYLFVRSFLNFVFGWESINIVISTTFHSYNVDRCIRSARISFRSLRSFTADIPWHCKTRSYMAICECDFVGNLGIIALSRVTIYKTAFVISSLMN